MNSIACSSNRAWSAMSENLASGVRCPTMSDFLPDVQTLRERARANIELGPVTDAYGADRSRVVEVLNGALAREVVCVLRSKRHYSMSQGLNAQGVGAEVLQPGEEEQGHAD